MEYSYANLNDHFWLSLKDFTSSSGSVEKIIRQFLSLLKDNFYYDLLVICFESTLMYHFQVRENTLFNHFIFIDLNWAINNFNVICLRPDDLKTREGWEKSLIFKVCLAGAQSCLELCTNMCYQFQSSKWWKLFLANVWYFCHHTIIQRCSDCIKKTFHWPLFT